MPLFDNRSRLQKLLSRTVGLMIVGAFTSAVTCQPSAVIGYNVNTTEDFSDHRPGDAKCEGGPDNKCSLRAAVEEINRRGVFSVIDIPAGTYELNGELTLSRGQTVRIIGEGPDLTIIRQTSSNARIFSIRGVENTVLIKGVTLTGGRLSFGNGGAINFQGNEAGRWRPKLEMENCRITDNLAGFRGGGIYALGNNSDIEITGCVIDNNKSTGGGCTGPGGGESGGGGIFLNGPTLKLIGSEVRDNCGSNGGGIRIANSENNLILQSTIAGNGAASRAGGIYTQDASGQIMVSTVEGNSGLEASGVLISGGDFALSDVTIADNNQASIFGTVALYARSGARLSIKNTVVARNPDTLNSWDCAGPITSLGGNLIGDRDPRAAIPCDLSALPTDQIDTRIFFLGLGGLADNGGVTRTMMPTIGGELQDRGVPGCFATDQIGYSDPSRVAPSGAACDIGAVEIQ